jgi:hypothetical protein
MHSAQGLTPVVGGLLFAQPEVLGGFGQVVSVETNANGRYSLQVPAGTLRMQIESGVQFQPCAAIVTPGPAANGDIHLISDPAQLGAHLPASFLSQTPLLSGMAFETASQGRRPLANVYIRLNYFEDDGRTIATTLTDTDGRFTFCAVPQVGYLMVSANKDGYQYFISDLISVSTPLEIEMRVK